MNETVGPIFKRYFANIQLTSCNGGSEAKYKAEIPVFHQKFGENKNHSASGINVLVLHSDKLTEVRVLVAPTVIKAIRQAVKEKTFLTVEENDIRIGLIVNNDTRKTVLMKTVNTKANINNCLKPCEIALKQREEVSLLLSDISTQWLLSPDGQNLANHHHIASFPKP